MMMFIFWDSGIDCGLWLRCCLISNLGWWPSTRSPLNVQLILAGGSEVTLREKLWWRSPFFWRGRWWWVMLMLMVMMVITCSWGRRSSAGWRWGTSRWATVKAGKRTRPRLPLIPDHKSTDSWQVFLFYPLSLGLNLWWGYSGWDGIWEIWIFLQGLRLTTPTLNPCNLLGSLK